jgi:hypothetical protein
MKPILLTVFLSMLFLPVNFYACTCIGTSTIEEDIKRADCVVYGKVMAAKYLQFLDSSDADFYSSYIHRPMSHKDSMSYMYFHGVEYTLDVIKFYKGKKVNKLAVITGLGHGDCGYQFEIGKEYIVYANQDYFPFDKEEKYGKHFFTDICKRTTDSTKREIAEIKKALK